MVTYKDFGLIDHNSFIHICYFGVSRGYFGTTFCSSLKLIFMLNRLHPFYWKKLVTEKYKSRLLEVKVTISVCPYSSVTGLWKKSFTLAMRHICLMLKVCIAFLRIRKMLNFYISHRALTCVCFRLLRNRLCKRELWSSVSKTAHLPAIPHAQPSGLLVS